MRLCIFRFCRGALGLSDRRCPACRRMQDSPAARAELARLEGGEGQ